MYRKELRRMPKTSHGIRRIIRGIGYVLRDVKERLTWEYESCENCGRCFRLGYAVKDNLWIKAMGSESGCLCLDCLIRLVEGKHISICTSDINLLWLFSRSAEAKNCVIKGSL